MEKQKHPASSQFNLATAIMLLTLMIPIGYLFWVNVLKEDATAVGWDRTTNQLVYPDSARAKTAATTQNTDLEKAAAENPSKQTYAALGLMYYQKGNFQGSVDAYKKALTFDANDAVNWNNLAAAYGALELFPEEIEACNKALTLDPNFQLAKNNLAWAQSQLKK